ncbi:type IV pilus modification protein PilV [Halomonas sp. M4R5S39]|uniref:type IV pilus modification protein PilV n=1 Tax=Halomonas kalidii TaxID=3043293 RepID=UPI0024A94C93|nr:type IV pilus modification protein PilV [Halomonas kalidii]MDI5983511.1 type IV pilus modification protein PilV [Halomonas kalidii]
MNGFTLLEVLVALLVLSFGFLGVAAMQVKSMQAAHVSYQRSIATLAAQDAGERLWAELANNPPVCPTTNTGDAWSVAWYGEWSQLLPGLVHDGSTISKNDCTYTITVEWQDDRFGGENVSNLVYVIRLPGDVS